jgi:hypothetical protein
MDAMNESIRRITEKAEKENEFDRLKKKFNFVKSSSSANFFPNSATSAPRKNYSPPKQMNILNTENPIRDKKSKPKYKTPNHNNKVFPNSKQNETNNFQANLKKSNSISNKNEPVRINNVVNIVNNNYNNLITHHSSLQKDIANLISGNTSSLSSDLTERKSTLNSKVNIRMANIELKDALNSFSKNDSFDYKNYYYLSEISGLKGINATKLGISDVNDEKSHYSGIPEENPEYQEIDEGSIVDYKKELTSYFSKKKVVATEDNEQRRLENSSILENCHPDIYSYSKMNSLFHSNPSYNLSSRLINDETRHHHTIKKESEFKFIERIREDKLKSPLFKLSSFWLLSDDSMYNLLSFLFEQYDELIKGNKSLAKKICLTLNNKFEVLIKSFCENFNSVLELQEFYFKKTDFKKSNFKMKKNKCKGNSYFYSK